MEDRTYLVVAGPFAGCKTVAQCRKFRRYGMRASWMTVHRVVDGDLAGREIVPGAGELREIKGRATNV